MKDWHIPLTELTNGQVAELFNLANLAGLDVLPVQDGDISPMIGTYDSSCGIVFSVWASTDGKQITYRQAVKKLHKLIDENDFNDTVKEMTLSTAELNAYLADSYKPNPETKYSDYCVKVSIIEPITMTGGGGGYMCVPTENKAKKHIIEAAKAMGIKPENLE